MPKQKPEPPVPPDPDLLDRLVADAIKRSALPLSPEDQAHLREELRIIVQSHPALAAKYRELLADPSVTTSDVTAAPGAPAGVVDATADKKGKAGGSR